jgi:hypothetical protein
MILVSLEAPKEECGPCLVLFTTMKMMTCATLGAHMIAWEYVNYRNNLKIII